MSRARKIRDAVSRAERVFATPVQATPDNERGKGVVWRLDWQDGPAVATLTSWLGARDGGALPAGDRAVLRCRRQVSTRCAVAVFADRVLAGDMPLPYESRGLAEAVDFPGSVNGQALRAADFAVARFGLDPADHADLYASPAIEYLHTAGRDGVLLDLWLDAPGGQPGCPPEGPPMLTVDTPAVRAAVSELYRTLRAELLSGCSHPDDHRARQLAAHTIRRAVPAMLVDLQRRTAGEALADGWSLRSLGAAIGLGDRTLGMTLGNCDEQLTLVRWLRAHTGEWTAACRSAGRAVVSGGYLSPEQRRDAALLTRTSGDVESLADSVPAARRLVAARGIWTDRTREHRDTLTALLDALDHTPRPTPRERHSRKGAPA